MYEIDEKDVKIVNLLLEDGRMTASDIARKIGDISERAVRYRIDRMVEEGVIRVSAIVSPQAFGLTTYADVWLEVESDKSWKLPIKWRNFKMSAMLLVVLGKQMSASRLWRKILLKYTGS
jgi:DNA-binding Lrp family transcriptional regulator